MQKYSDSENGRSFSADNIKYPKAVFCIFGNIFLDRVCIAGITAILALFLHRKLGFDQDTSTAIFHSNEFISYFSPIIGAIIADSWLGHFETLLLMVGIFTAGCTLMFFTAIESLHLPIVLTFIGFMTVVFGSGCTRPNLTAFGANQFKLPQQSKPLEQFFTMQIFMIHFGSLIGRLIAPVLKEDVKCSGSDDCYSLPFGSAALAMFLGFFLLLIGRSRFVRRPPSGNMLIKVLKCIWDGLSEKFKNSKLSRKHHWLDYAEAKHGRKLVEETKTVLNVLVLYLPLPIYWAVYQLQGSRWTFQATLMNGDVGFYTIKPDQMIALNSIFGMIVIWLNDYLIYPSLTKIRITTLPQKMLIGGLLAVVSTMIAGFMETRIHGTNMHILWLVPQYLIASFSDNFLFNSHLNFAYNEAPDSMKSVMTSFVFFVIAIGNIFVVTVSGSKLFQSQANEFFFFSVVLFFAMIWFGFLAKQYQDYRKAPITQIFNDHET